MGTEQWWKHAVGYEAYIRSFADGNDDSVGQFFQADSAANASRMPGWAAIVRIVS